MKTYLKTIKSPVDELNLIANDNALLAVLWGADDSLLEKYKGVQKSIDQPILLAAEAQLERYFLGKLKKFNLPLEMIGTEFQKRVWLALLEIPYGETRSYGQLAKQIGDPKASRAVGMANGKNPISIVVPCHRVIGASGKLVGFGGGLTKKEILLRTEGHSQFY